ncbi:MAG: hypothetical protein CMJ78_27245 [Planctomycetaceae bacterium]|nr:hypothetical protein [Planctomycetaceae bacterium]
MREYSLGHTLLLNSDAHSRRLEQGRHRSPHEIATASLTARGTTIGTIVAKRFYRSMTRTASRFGENTGNLA